MRHKKGSINATIFDSVYNLKMADHEGEAVAESGVKLSVEERNILSVAFKIL